MLVFGYFLTRIEFVQDPLNSGDDVSEGDNTDLFETENVVVCQYDKVRVYNLLWMRWWEVLCHNPQY